MKKKIISLLIIVISIIGVFTISISNTNKRLPTDISSVTNDDIGKTYIVNMDRYYNSDDMFCVEHNQNMKGDAESGENIDMYYNLVSKVTIEGATAKAFIRDSSNKLIEKTLSNPTNEQKNANAKFAYILASEYKSDPNKSFIPGVGFRNYNKTNSAKQNAIWDYAYDWMTTVGTKLGLKSGLVSNTEGFDGLGDSLINEAGTDANKIINASKLVDNTDKDKIKVVNYKNDEGKEYLRVGPFNWTFGSNLTSIYLYDQNNERISHKLYSQYNGSEQEFIEINKIKSGKNFYVYVPNNGKVTEIKKIEGKTAPTVNKVNIWFFENTEKKYQNVISVDSEKKPSEVALNLDLGIEVTGSLKVIKVDKDNNTVKLKDVEFKIQNKETGKYVKKSSEGKISYVSKESDATVFKTDKNGEISIKKLVIGTYVAYETKNPDVRYEIIKDSKEKKVTLDKTAELKIENERITLGEFTIDKHNSEKTDLKLANVKFTIQMTEGKYKGKYVNIDKNGKAKYQDAECELVTDKNGKITIKDMYLGKYQVKETANGNYGYEVDYDKNITLDKEMQQKDDKYTLSVPNVQKYIKLSGYVWVDEHSSKKSEINHMYKESNKEYTDDEDSLLGGVIVRLRGTTLTGEAAETTTIKEEEGKGKYYFDKVPVEDLETCYIEFEYDGYTYTNVKPHIDKDNGSKASEKSIKREEFNNHFTTIVGNTANSGWTLNEKGERDYYLSYKTENHTSAFINEGNLPIKAYTNNTGYKVIDHYVVGQDEIKNINLGLYRRAEPDISLVKDLHSVNLSINGYNNVYNYAQRFQHQYKVEPTEKDLNVGVKYKNDYTGTYSRAIYEADYLYHNENDTNKELKVYLTYKIRIINETTNLKVKVNSIVDYFDSNYTLKGYGTSVDARGNINNIKVKEADEDYNQNGYKKVIINTNTILEGQQYDDIYVQFELNRAAVQKIMSEKPDEVLNNVAEINSYSVIGEDGKAYAGIDKDSNPGNAIPGNPDTYEDDTDSAPGLKLETTDARKIRGAVFVDKVVGKTGPGKVRLGDGVYNDGEAGIANVKVTLTEISGTGKEYTATTGKDGTFEISNFIPGDYTLTYTWGDETYTVQNYKGTIYKDERRQSNKEWYKVTSPRFSDALDDYNTRIEIDKQMLHAGQNIETTQKITTMNSTTPVMGIGIENTGTETSSPGNKYEFIIKNVDFGIVERAKQSIEVEKRVRTFKATLANGQVIVDATIDENGKIEGQRSGVTREDGFVKLEMDNELIQGTTIEVGYEIKVTNNSELDYTSKEFYHYGREEGEKVKITPTGIVDYLDKDWGFDEQKNTDWQIKTVEEIKSLVADKVYLTEDSEINDKYILYTESLKDKKIAPEESEAIMLNVSKILSTSEDISLDNETEVVKVEKTGGSKLEQIPGDYIPGKTIEQSDTSKAETVMVMPHTGGNMDYLPYIILGMSTLIILGTGIIFIKKKVLK